MAWSGAITSRASVENSSTASQTMTTASFTPAANSLLFVYSVHSTVPNIQISNTAGLTFTRHQSSVFDFADTADIQHALFVASVGGSPSSMTVTVDPYTTTAQAHQSLVVFDVTNAAIKQNPVFNFQDGSSQSHTTAALASATTSGNLTIAGFGCHTIGATAAAAPSGFSTVATMATNYHNVGGVFYRTTHAATTVTCADVGESLYMTGSVLLEIETPSAGGGGVFLGTTEITNIRLGTTALSKVYVGTSQIWP
jgi:hypothetical protein